jgi:hypothetical protein
MPDLRFEWDESKNAANQRKHRVSFEEAQKVSFDDRAILIEDPERGRRGPVHPVGIERGSWNSCRLPLRPVAGRHHLNHLRSEGSPRGASRLRDEVAEMGAKYDFSKGNTNPYARQLKKRITIRRDEETLEYFKDLAEDTEIPYQTLINL